MSLRKEAMGKECQARIPFVCSRDDSTTILAHIRRGNAGMGMKPPDTCGVWACYICHDAIDGRSHPAMAAHIDTYTLEAMVSTLTELDKLGYRMVKA